MVYTIVCKYERQKRAVVNTMHSPGFIFLTEVVHDNSRGFEIEFHIEKSFRNRNLIF